MLFLSYSFASLNVLENMVKKMKSVNQELTYKKPEGPLLCVWASFSQIKAGTEENTDSSSYRLNLFGQVDAKFSIISLSFHPLIHPSIHTYILTYIQMRILVILLITSIIHCVRKGDIL